MGICLDTEQNEESQEVRDGRMSGRAASSQVAILSRMAATPPTSKFPMQNESHVKFEAPKVPVIFVLGGPGSGKVTHCDNLMQEKRGVVHINMTDLLQQYAIGNDMQDFGTLSSKTVTEVLMLEMKMSPAAKTYLVSGYPRSMRDVAEYSDKIQVVNGVILVSWRQKVLERQIEYGAKLGHVVLSLARMELNNFYKNVMPVADYFDQSDLLVAVNGERNPGDVYKDFRSAVLRILGSQENLSAAANGVTGAGADGIPGEIVGVEPAPPPPPPPPKAMPRIDSKQIVQADVITVREADMDRRNRNESKEYPPAIWVIGGPGSNKSSLCQKAVAQNPGWIHFSVGRKLRDLAENGELRPGSDAYIVRQSVTGGEMVPHSVVMRIIQDKMDENRGAKGIVIDGFPRDLEQTEAFERTFKQRPTVILLDCSKLQLGRGRLDDSVAAFRRRLELFRELSLPMLKSLDSDQRLIIVDGDTDTPPVQEDFNNTIRQFMEEASGGMTAPRPSSSGALNRTSARLAAGAAPHNQQGIRTISQRVQNAAPESMANGIRHMANGGIKANGGIGNGHINGMIPNGLGGMASKVVPLQNNPYRDRIDGLDSHM